MKIRISVKLYPPTPQVLSDQLPTFLTYADKVEQLCLRIDCAFSVLYEGLTHSESKIQLDHVGLKF